MGDMMRRSGKIIRLLSIILALSLTLSACKNTSSRNESSYKKKNTVDEDIIEEKIIEEDEIDEDILSEYCLEEYITEEIYLEEIVVAEKTITELLLEEESIEEVSICSTVYVPEDHIEDFAKNSQATLLFDDEAELETLLKEVAVGTGVIVTLVVLKQVGNSNLVKSVVASAADRSVQFAKNGAIVNSLFGAFTGVTDEIDHSGRLSAAVAFATATTFLILTALGGVTTPFAGLSLIFAAVNFLMSGKDMIQKFTSTDVTDIDWGSINWKKVGISATKKAIKNAGEGYMWGSIIGAGYGGVEGFHKYYAPYSLRDARINSTPAEDSKYGHWTGERGESSFVLDDPIKLDDGTIIKRIKYQNGIPDFSEYAEAEVKIANMTAERLGAGNNYNQADEALAEIWSESKYKGQKWTADDVRAYREANNLTWHEMNNMEYMQLVPYEVNHQFKHLGGVSEYKTMVGNTGGEDFD